MVIWIRRVLSLAFVLAGLVAIFILLSNAIQGANKVAQGARDSAAGAVITSSYISNTPFGEEVGEVERDAQIFYNLKVNRKEGQPCYVRTSWRWTLHLPTGDSVMWNSADGEFYAGDKTERLAQSIIVPTRLIPGRYTLSRLSVFKCGDQEDFARTVRNTDLIVK